MQAKLRNFYGDFGTRLAFIREKRGLTLGELAGGKAASTAKSWESGSVPRPDQWPAIAERLGLSVSFVFLGEPKSRSDYDFVAKFADELGVPPAPKGFVVEESEHFNYLKPGSQEALPEPRRTSPSSKMLEPRYQPRAEEPTPQMCADHFAKYLARALQEPGGVGFTWRLLQKHFPLDEFDGPKNTPKP